MKAMLATLFVFASPALAGQFVQKTMYTQAHLSVGSGRSLAAAIKDAKSAIPAQNDRDFFEADSSYNSPAIQCLNGVEWTDATECGGGYVQYVIPLRHVTR